MLKLVFATAILLSAASGAFARGVFNGDYTVSFFNDPGHIAGTQICLDITPSAPIAGFPESATFVDTVGDGISGQLIVDGSYVHLMMLVTGFGDNVDLIGKGKEVAGNYDDFYSGYNGGADTDISSGTFTLVSGCSNGALRRHPTHHSVTR
jgi:hypothetical protein